MKKYLIFLLLLGLASCETDVLNKKALDEIDEELMWTNVDLTRLYLNGIYRDMPGSWDRFLDLATDIGEGGHSWLASNQYNNGDVTPDNFPYAWYWGDFYYSIRSLNTFFANCDKMEGDPEEIEMLIGEAYFLRAYYYSDLVMCFGRVPIIKEIQTLEDDLFVSRNSIEQCVEFICADLDEAIDRLPLEWEGESVGRATIGAAHSLKSRILLFDASPLNNPSNEMSKWQAVADACEDVFDLEFYALYPDYGETFLIENNEEVIFDVQYSYLIRNNDIDYYNNPQGFSGAYGMLRPTQEMIDRYEMANGLPITDPASGYDANDPYDGRDPRFYMSILYNGCTWRDRVVEMFNDGANGPGDFDQYGTSNSMTGYYLRKFLNEKNPIAFGIPKAEENWILIRYAEILLNYAEACLALGREDDARDAINLIRRRAGMPSIEASETGQALQDRYVNERIVELCFENQYFFDVRRWLKASEWLSKPVHKMEIVKTGEDNFTHTVREMERREWRDALYWMPIPQDEIDKNPNLTNEGY